jgi:hypothetical protein
MKPSTHFFCHGFHLKFPFLVVFIINKNHMQQYNLQSCKVAGTVLVEGRNNLQSYNHMFCEGQGSRNSSGGRKD